VAGSRRICRQETRVELNFLTTETVDRDDLVPSKNLHALGNLFHSLVTTLLAKFRSTLMVSRFGL